LIPFILACLLLLSPESKAELKVHHHKAYVYFGKGSCEEEPQPDGTIRNEQCSTMGMEMAKKAGLIPVAIHPQDLNEKSTPEEIADFFKDVGVWIQPGGNSVAYEVMNPVLIHELKRFVQSGGGYVGWCAGAFMAGLGMDNQNSLRIFPAAAIPFSPVEKNEKFALIKKNEKNEEYSALSLESVTWNKKPRRIYFEGGAFLEVTEDSIAEVKKDKNFGKMKIIARYSDDKIAAARATYGKGRVFITGLHPEAPLWWSEEDHLVDTDGVDHELAVEMIRWVAK